MERKKKPMRFSNWPISSPQRPRSPSSAWSSSSRLPSFSSDITDFYDAAEDWSENMEQASSTGGEILESPNLKAFTFMELKCITGNFHPDRDIGVREFGLLFSGWIDEQTLIPSRPGSGMVVAVKIWTRECGRGFTEWRLQHPNIVKLIGFCSEDAHLALVYEYVQRCSLDNHFPIFGEVDLYGMGCLLLQFVWANLASSGPRSHGKRTLVDWAKGKKSKLIPVMDPRLKEEYLKKGAYLMVKLAQQWIDIDEVSRPTVTDFKVELEHVLAMKRKDDAPLPIPAPCRSLWESFESPEATFPSSSNTLASLYRRPSLLMCHGSMEKAKAEASLQNKWLIVNLQAEEEFNSHMLNRDTWSHETVESIIKNSFIFWQVYNDSDEGKEVQTYYNLISLPAILIVDPVTGRRMHAWNDMVQPDDLLEQLLPYMDRSPKEYTFGTS